MDNKKSLMRVEQDLNDAAEALYGQGRYSSPDLEAANVLATMALARAQLVTARALDHLARAVPDKDGLSTPINIVDVGRGRGF